MFLEEINRLILKRIKRFFYALRERQLVDFLFLCYIGRMFVGLVVDAIGYFGYVRDLN